MKDIAKITKATRNLIHRGNTVIAIEHNKQYIASADHIVELGPVGGPDGGYLIRQSSKPQNIAYQLSFKQVSETPAYLEVNNINFRNIHGQNARFPIGGITCITEPPIQVFKQFTKSHKISLEYDGQSD